MTRIIGAVSIGLFMLGSAFALAPLPEPPADMPEPPGYVCYRATEPIVIDGKLDDEAWAAAPWCDSFVDIMGSTKPKPRFKTRMKMLWDDENLYIAAELEEPHVWATLTKHDSMIFQDNAFEVFINPDGNNHNYAELELNALNTTWDLFLTKPYRDRGKALSAWEILGLKTAVHIDGTINDPSDKDRGWTLEIVWPWKGLKEIANVPVPPRDNDRWRMNFSRMEWQMKIADGKYQKIGKEPDDIWVWSPQGVFDIHRPENWGYVQFSKGEPGKVAYKPDPSASTRKLLHEVYYAERRYRDTNSRYSSSFADLGLKLPPEFSQPPMIETTGNSFEASVPSPAAKGGKAQKWSILQDSRISLSK